MVEATRPSWTAIVRIDNSTAIPREIVSLSESVKDKRDRVRCLGRMPPVLDNMPAMDP
jgi:hypothetical protein